MTDAQRIKALEERIEKLEKHSHLFPYLQQLMWSVQAIEEIIAKASAVFGGRQRK